MDDVQLRQIIAQHLLTDQRFGARWVPIPAATAARVGPPAIEAPRTQVLYQAEPSSRAAHSGSAEHSPQATSTATVTAAAPAPRGVKSTSPAATTAPPRARPVSPIPVDTSEKGQRLAALNETQVRDCRKCELCQTRTQTVFGQGNPNARVVFVGEAPGFDEDRQGLAFVGKAGQLLTRMIQAMGLSRDEVYICNVLKCRPPNNRTPNAEEILRCSPYLREQLQIIAPQVIVALGAPAAKTVLHTAENIGRMRGHFRPYFFSGETGVGPSVPCMPTFHPAYLLRSPDEKVKAWADLQEVMKLLGLQRPGAPAGSE